MDTLIDRLQHQADGLDATSLDPDRALPDVVRRGKRYLVVVSAASILGVTAAVAAAAVAVPQLVQQMQGPTQPTVLSTPEDGDVEVEEEPIEEPSVEPTPDTTIEDPEQNSPAPPPADVTAPDLVVLDPADGATITSEKVTFSGTTEPGARVEAGGYEATVDDDGRWSILLIASDGPNTVTFTATDTADNATTATVTVTYEPQTSKDEPGDKPTQDEPADSTLTASQQSSVLDAAPHKNTYSGTAAPGAKVAVVSQYGSDYAWADDTGRWEVLVDFDPPAGTKTFPVTVKLHHQPDVTRTFQLTTVNDTASTTFTANQKHSTLDGAPYTNTYSGTANPGEKIKVISDHGWEYTYADGAGNWNVQVTFDPPGGTKTFPVTARYYHDSSVARTFELTTVADPTAAFTASQNSATVPASNPTNVYSGTGQPGHEVLIWTEQHGQTTTVIGSDGSWQVSLTYTDVAPGDTFHVKALDQDSDTRHMFEVTIT